MSNKAIDRFRQIRTVSAVIVLSLVVLASTNGGVVQGATLPIHASALRVELTPNPPRLHSRLTVRILGLHQGEGLRMVFHRIPVTDAFGGRSGHFMQTVKGRCISYTRHSPITRRS
jgi:hypothetical protein